MKVYKVTCFNGSALLVVAISNDDIVLTKEDVQ